MLKDLPTGSSSVSATPDGTAILRALPVAAALIDERLRYIDSNPEFATLARSCASALRGASCAQSLPIDPGELLPTLRRTLDSGHEGSVTAAPRLADDQAGQRLRCRCRRIDTASPCILLLVEIDAAPAPPPQQQAFRSVLDNIFTFAGLLAPDGTLLEANRAPLEAAGITLHDVRGRKFWDCHWWNFDPQVQARIRDAVEAAAGGATQRFDIAKRLAGSNFVSIDLMLSPMRDDEGRISHLVYSAIDVSARKAGEAALQRSEQRFRQVVESAPDGLAMVDGAGRMVLVNAGMESIFGYSREEMLDHCIEMLMPERHRAAHGGLFQGYLEHPSARDMAGRRELYARRRDGSEFPVEIGLNPIRTETGTMVLATIQDVTTRKADRRMIEKALEEKTVLLNEIHHRVKNNLQVISSLLNLQARGAEPSVASALAESQGRVKAMALIHQLLYERNDFSQVDLSAYLRRLCALLQEGYRGSRANFKLTVDVPGEIFLSLQSAVPCGLLVNELVTNAVKHAFPEQRSGHIEVSLAALDARHCVITVADDGVGLPEGVAPGISRSLGMQLIPLLADQAGGHWKLLTEHGTRFELHIETALQEHP